MAELILKIFKKMFSLTETFQAKKTHKCSTLQSQCLHYYHISNLSFSLGHKNTILRLRLSKKRIWK